MATNIPTPIPNCLGVVADPLDCFPALSAPPGHVSNFTDPPSKKELILTLDAIFTSLMLAAVIVRVWIRLKVQKKLGLDDYACVAAAVGSTIHLVMYTEWVKFGYGRNQWNIPAKVLLNPDNMRMLSSNGVIYPWTILCTKLALLLLYVRLFHVSRTTTWIIYATIGICTAFYLGMIGVGIKSLTGCSSLSDRGKTFCKNYSGPGVLINASFNVVSDFLIFIIPFPLVWNLRMRKKQKIGVIIVFAAGLAACGTSLARMVNMAINYKNPDTLGVQATNSLYTIVEINVGIIVSCVSTFPPFFKDAKRVARATGNSINRRLLTLTGKGSNSGWSSKKNGHSSTSLAKKPVTPPDNEPYLAVSLATIPVTKPGDEEEGHEAKITTGEIKK